MSIITVTIDIETNFEDVIFIYLSNNIVVCLFSQVSNQANLHTRPTELNPMQGTRSRATPLCPCQLGTTLTPMDSGTSLKHPRRVLHTQHTLSTPATPNTRNSSTLGKDRFTITVAGKPILATVPREACLICPHPMYAI